MNWPLPLTPIEELFFVEDRPAYPFCCFVRAEFSGCFEPATFETAIRATLREHPMLTARVMRCGRRLTWVPVDNPQPSIEWNAKPTGDGLPPARRIDLNNEMGIRFQVFRGVAGSTFIIQFHHAVCDGIGIFQFLHDFLIEYATACGHPPGDAKMQRFDPTRLARRGAFGMTPAQRLAMAPRQIMNLWEARRFVFRSPKALLPGPVEPNDSTLPGFYPAAISARLTSEETAGLQATARKLGVSVNDLLLRDAFLACDEWRKIHGAHRRGEWLRLTVPMNLRTEHHQLLSAANVVSMVFLDRCDLNFDDPSALLTSVHHEMTRYKRRQSGFTLLLAAALGRRLPGGLKKHTWANKCLASSVLTNLGIMFEHSVLKSSSGLLVAGDTTLERIEMLPPIRPHMTASFAVGTYANRLWTTLHYDLRPMTQPQAQDMMTIFHRRIRSSLDSMQ